MLTTAQLLGAAEQGHLFVQGTLNSKEPAGGILHIDVFGRAPGSQLDGTLLGSVTATATASGSVPFQGVLKTDVPASEAVAAVLREGARAQTFLPADAGQWSRALAVRAGSALDGKGIPLGLEDLGPNHGDGNQDGIPDVSQPEVATVPIATTGAFATLVAPGHALEHVQVSDPPQTATSLPWGLFNFQVTHVPVGGSAVVELHLPDGAAPSSYYKEDPATGVLTPFLYDGKVGAEIHGNVVTLHLADGDLFDADHAANGTIVDPGGPSGPDSGNASWSTPVLQAVQPFGDAGPGRLFLEGSINSSAPIGASDEIDFFATDFRSQRESAQTVVLGTSEMTARPPHMSP